MTACELDFGETKQSNTRNQVKPMGSRQPLSLYGYFNSSFLANKTYGRNLVFDFRSFLEAGSQNESRLLRVGSYNFAVQPDGKNMVLLEIGDLHRYTNRLEVSSAPDSVCIAISKPVYGIELLLAAEARVRLTDMEVGEIILQYDDGYQKREPLVYGRKLDCSTIPFADEVEILALDYNKHVTGCCFLADHERIMDHVTINVTSFDTSIGVLALNLCI
jgi:hypothetical protein